MSDEKKKPDGPFARSRFWGSKEKSGEPAKPSIHNPLADKDVVCSCEQQLLILENHCRKEGIPFAEKGWDCKQCGRVVTRIDLRAYISESNASAFGRKPWY